MSGISLLSEVTVNGGGKAAALGRLIQAGFNVPPGFVVHDAIFEELEVLQAFDNVGSDVVAVRSSAAVEDSLTGSWAGHFETFLNVDKTQVVERIRTVFDLAQGQEMSVIVQRMVKADVAGVAFSVDPVTDKNRILIEAVPGLGDKLVSGEVTPETDLLKPEQTAELTHIVQKIEAEFGYPIDVEWALANSTFFILQARPITTLGLIDTDKALADLQPIEYWSEELAPPLFGITDMLQPALSDNFLCVFDGARCRFYYINGRAEHEAQTGFYYFSQLENLERYRQQTEDVVVELERLPTGNIPLTELIDLSRKANGVYDTSEAARLRRYEEEGDTVRLQKIADLRLRLREALELLYPRTRLALNQLAEKHAISKDDLFFYTFAELTALMENGDKTDQREITTRKAGYVYWVKDAHSSFYTGREHRMLRNRLETLETAEYVDELQGLSVSRGIARGVAHVVLHDTKDLSFQSANFPDGGILITEMTRPQSFDICRRAKAIITDEGGVTSHAAIITRELGIPCITGTKVATKVLKTGDMVEVDGNEGVVRVIRQ